MISDASRGNSVFFLRADACRAHVGFMSLGLTLAFLLSAAPVDAQLKAKVSIDPSQQKAVLYTSSIGVAADRWDTRAFDPATMQLLGEAVTNVRFPGNGGIEALYHWSTGTIINPYTNDRAPAFARERHFPAAVPVIDALGSAVISVNYGSNLDGCGGGEPLEAAAWVACANGNPGNAQPIGKDSKGNDWKTVGFWRRCARAHPFPPTTATTSCASRMQRPLASSAGQSATSLVTTASTASRARWDRMQRTPKIRAKPFAGA